MQRVAKKVKKVKDGWAKKRRNYLKARPHRSFKMTKWENTQPFMESVRLTVRDAFALIWRERGILLWLAFIYMIATYALVGGIAQADFIEFKQATLDVFGGKLNSISTVMTLFSSTMSGGLNTDMTELQQFLAVLLAVLFWLAVIWTLRMRFANQKIGVRDALYSSSAPLIAYCVVSAFIVVQLIPGAVGLVAYNVAQNGGYLQGGIEVMLFALAVGLLCCLSFYWASTSLLALVVVTLPQMRPWRAMQVAGEMAVGRRIRLLGHFAALFIVLAVCWAAILFPALLLDSWLRQDWLPILPLIVQFLSAFTVLYAATYIYKLYRSML